MNGLHGNTSPAFVEPDHYAATCFPERGGVSRFFVSTTSLASDIFPYEAALPTFNQLNQAVSRATFIATAVKRCCRWVFANSISCSRNPEDEQRAD